MYPIPPPDDRDFDNPYAPPQSTFEPEAAPRPSGSVPFTVSDVFTWSWSIFGQRMWPCVYIVWGVVGVDFALGLGMQFLLTSLTDIVRGPRFLFVSAYLLRVVVEAWLGIGMNLGLLKIARREPVSFEVIFTGGRAVVSTILAAIVVGVLIGAPLFILVLGLMALFVTGIQHMDSWGALVLFVLGCGLGAVFFFYMIARLMQFYYLVIDRNLGVFESIQLSWHLTRGRAATIFLVYILQMCVGLAGLLACCVGVIFAAPLSSLMSVVTYLALSEPARPVDKTPPIVWVEEL